MDSTTKQPGAFYLISEERKRQDKRWGGPSHDDRHDNAAWMLFLMKQVGHLAEFMAAFDNSDHTSNTLQHNLGRCIHEATQAAAVLVAYIESCQRDLETLRHDHGG